MNSSNVCDSVVFALINSVDLSASGSGCGGDDD